MGVQGLFNRTKSGFPPIACGNDTIILHCGAQTYDDSLTNSGYGASTIYTIDPPTKAKLTRMHIQPRRRLLVS